MWPATNRHKLYPSCAKPHHARHRDRSMKWSLADPSAIEPNDCRFRITRSRESHNRNRTLLLCRQTPAHNDDNQITQRFVELLLSRGAKDPGKQMSPSSDARNPVFPPCPGCLAPHRVVRGSYPDNLPDSLPATGVPFRLVVAGKVVVASQRHVGLAVNTAPNRL
jgi:hypothetical protein